MRWKTMGCVRPVRSTSAELRWKRKEAACKSVLHAGLHFDLAIASQIGSVHLQENLGRSYLSARSSSKIPMICAQR